MKHRESTSDIAGHLVPAIQEEFGVTVLLMTRGDTGGSVSVAASPDRAPGPTKSLRRPVAVGASFRRVPSR